MLALMDIGNTNIVLGVYEGARAHCLLRFRTERKATSDELGHWMTSLLARRGISVEQIDAVCIASVVTQLDRVLEQACRVYFSREPLWVGKQLNPNMQLFIDKPEELGADRLVNAYAAWKQFEVPVIVVDMGTATTFDVVDAQGNYLGGAIAPGIEISGEALFQTASKLNRISLEKPCRAIGKNTKEHLQIGLVMGHAALIDGLVAHMQNELGLPSKVIATGGLAPFMKQASKSIQIVEPDLTLSGLCLLYQEYISGTRDSVIVNRPQCVVGHQEIAC